MHYIKQIKFLATSAMDVSEGVIELKSSKWKLDQRFVQRDQI